LGPPRRVPPARREHPAAVVSIPSFSTAQQLTIWFFFLLDTVLFLLLVAR
jgi:hypothetical protein